VSRHVGDTEDTASPSAVAKVIRTKKTAAAMTPPPNEGLQRMYRPAEPGRSKGAAGEADGLV
jgi:hypothetical protein